MDKFKEYRKLIDIDYYVYFTKAYFAFNAYLKAEYPNNNDREKINNIKDNLLIESKFKQLINEGKHFSDDLISLKNNLNMALIHNQGNCILCSKVMIYNHREEVLFLESFRGVSYNIRAINGEKFTIKVKEENSPPFKFEELENILNNMSVTSHQRVKVNSIICGFVASYSIDLEPEIEKLKTLNEFNRAEQDEIIKKVYRGFIEILYSLRNALFHSEVKPNSDVMKVYKFAYFILRKILWKIPVT